MVEIQNSGINFDMLPIRADRTYGGATGAKVGVTYNNEVWMLKRAQNLHDREMKNVELSYANDPISEWLGSHIYSVYGLPVHETLYGTYKGRVAVICKDLAYPGRITELRELRNTILDESIKQDISGMSTKLSDIMVIIDASILQEKDAAKRRFWEMFVVDALIGNTDRNNGNWGFLPRSDGKLHLCPVYDNGGCLNNKKSDTQLSSYLNDSESLSNLVQNFTTNFTDDAGKRINPFHYIERNLDNQYIRKALYQISTLDMNAVIDLINSIDVKYVSYVRKAFYREVLFKRHAVLNTLKKKIANSLVERIQTTYNISADESSVQSKVRDLAAHYPDVIAKAEGIADNAVERAWRTLDLI